MTTCPSCATELELDAAYCGRCGARVRARHRTLVGAELDGRFRVEAKLAEGGFGSIYRATDLGSGHVVALKVLHAELAADASLAARFRREGDALSSLASPHTVSVYERGETDDGTLYIAMELLRGESLLSRFRARGPLPWRGVLEIMKQVCRSLGEAHALGIVHRDLKPANIHLEAHDHVKVLDFGIAKLMRGSDSDDGDDLTRVGQAVGTLEYMAPEQLIGAGCDGRADIYALGVVVYEMLTGRRPYADATGPTSLVTAVMTQPLIPPSTLFDRACLPRAVDELVLRCLAKDPSERFADVGEVIAAIDAILVPHARGSWSAELDDETTWIDAPPAPPVLPAVIVTPSRQPIVHAADAGLGHAVTHVQPTMLPTTSPGLGTPSRLPIAPARPPTDIASPTPRGLARGSVSPIAPYARARRESDLDLPPFAAPFADGSRVRPRPTPDPQPATGAPPPAAPPSAARQPGSTPVARRLASTGTPHAAPPAAAHARQPAPSAPGTATPVGPRAAAAHARQPAPSAPGTATPVAPLSGAPHPAHVEYASQAHPTSSPPTGSLPLVDLASDPTPAPVLPAPTYVRLASAPGPTDRTRAPRPLSALRVTVWATGLLSGGVGLGALIASLVG